MSIHTYKNYKFVEVPKDAYDIVLGNHCVGFKSDTHIGEKDTNGFFHAYQELGFGRKHHIITTTDKLTETIAESICETKKHPIFSHNVYRIGSTNIWYNSAMEAIIKLFSSDKNIIYLILIYSPNQELLCQE